MVAVGLVAAGTLALQVVLTRLFSAVLFYHFGFLAISLALLGVGAGAILVYVRPRWFEGPELERGLARWSLAFALLVPVAAFVLVRLHLTTLTFDITAEFAWSFAVACIASFLPLLAAGIVIALAVRAWTRSIGRLYAFDLVGAALGATAIVPLMWIVDAPTLMVSLSVMGAGAAVLFAWHRGASRSVALAALAGAIALTVISGGTRLFAMDPLGPQPVAERWTPLSRVLGYEPVGSSPNAMVVYDRVIGEIVPYRRGTPIPGWRRLQEGPQSIGYALRGPGGRALVIGGGGGRDILAALSERQRVDVIELNRGIRDLVDDDMGRISGSPYTLPGVRTTIGDGRSTLAARSSRYDQIQLGFTDTYSGNSGQAFALNESNLYTVEAFQEYLDHLRPDGILNVSRPFRANGNEGLRITVLALEALRRAGYRDPARHVAVLLGSYGNAFNRFPYATTLVKRTPFTAPELARLRHLAAARTLGVAFEPGGPYRGQWAALAAASSPAAFCARAAYDLCPPTDDKPFFFNMRRFGDIFNPQTRGALSAPDPIFVLGLTLLVLLALAAIAVAAPLFLVPRASRPRAGALSYFAWIGLGFLVLEVVLIQRFVLFLGFPTYSLSVVLAALLLFTGAGAWLSQRFEAAPRRALLVALGAGSAMIIAAAYGLQPLLRALIDLPFAARVALTVVILAPAGLALGMAMPLGLRRLSGLWPTAAPWAWGVNGVASVVASVLAVSVAITWGFAATTLLAGACYLLALAHAALGRWPAADAAHEPVRREGAPEPVPEPAPAFAVGRGTVATGAIAIRPAESPAHAPAGGPPDAGPII